MKTLSFKTRLTSSDAVAAVTEPLSDIEAIEGGLVEVEAADHLLTVQTIDRRIAEQGQQAVA